MKLYLQFSKVPQATLSPKNDVHATLNCILSDVSVGQLILLPSFIQKKRVRLLYPSDVLARLYFLSLNLKLCLYCSLVLFSLTVCLELGHSKRS